MNPSIGDLPHDVETASCPACGRLGVDTRTVARPLPHLFRSEGPFTVARCSSCGTLFTNPSLTSAALSRWYGALQSRPPGARDGADRSSGSALLRAWRNAEQRSPIHDLIEAGPVLDVGCGCGSLIAELGERGITGEGVEWERRVVEEARAAGLAVSYANLLEFEPATAHYRHIVLSHVLEHLPEPARLLRRLALGLRPNGSLLIVVPNSGSALRYAFRNSWMGWDVPFHLTHFTPRSLALVAERARLHVVRLRSIGMAEELRRSINHFTGRERRLLAARLAYFPFARALGALGLGSVLLAEAKAWRDDARSR